MYSMGHHHARLRFCSKITVIGAMRRMLSVVGGPALAAHGVARGRGLRRSAVVRVRRTKRIVRAAADAGQGDIAWWAETPQTVAETLGVDPESGLSAPEVASRREVRS